MPIKAFMSRAERVWLLVIVCVGIVYWNGRFVDWCSPQRIGAMNDVPSILAGFRASPNLLIDGLWWWHGPWIQEGIGAFRPLSSYLLWIDCWIGTRFGFFWTALVGVGLLLVDSLLCMALAWRFTRSRWSVMVAALLAPAGRLFVWSGTMPFYWLAWFAVHHDLMMIGWLLGAVLAFDFWLECGRLKYLSLAWGCFVLGVWSKEFVYIFPFMALSLALGRHFESGVLRPVAMRHVVLMTLFVASMIAYRYCVLPHPYNPPPLKWVHMVRRPWLYWFGPFYGFVLSGETWFSGLAVLWFSLAGALIRWKQSTRGVWLARPFASIGVTAGMLTVTALYLTVTGYAAQDAFWYIFDGRSGWLHCVQLGQMIATTYVFFLLFKYRRQDPTMAALSLMMLSYIPVWTYLGWHYTLAGWFFRCAIFWPLVVHLAIRDLSGYWNSAMCHYSGQVQLKPQLLEEEPRC